MDGDILSDVLHAVRLTGAVFFDIRATSPWVAQAPPSREIAALVMPGAEHVIEYHLLVDGSGWANLLAADSPPMALEAGSIVIFPHGDPHVLASTPDLRSEPNLAVYDAAMRDGRLPFRLDMGDGGPQGARIICGFLGCDALPFNPLIHALPRMLHVAGGERVQDPWLRQLIEATVKETREHRIGGRGIVAKLGELIFIEAVRRYAEEQGADARSWLAGLRDRHIGQAIRLLHRNPARPWSLAELAREVGVSRSVLAERFVEHVGLPPMTYLHNWRMQIAAALLAEGHQSLRQVAAGVGYESEAAFSRAFKRSTGRAPSEWRRAPGP